MRLVRSPRAALLTASAAVLVLILPSATQAQTVSCTGVAAWVATTTYAAGSRVTYQGGLYQAIVQTTNVPPNYCPACNWWQFLGTCGGGGTCNAAPAVPTGLNSPSRTSTSINVAWNASAQVPNCAANQYRLFLGNT